MKWKKGALFDSQILLIFVKKGGIIEVKILEKGVYLKLQDDHALHIMYISAGAGYESDIAVTRYRPICSNLQFTAFRLR